MKDYKNLKNIVCVTEYIWKDLKYDVQTQLHCKTINLEV